MIKRHIFQLVLMQLLAASVSSEDYVQLRYYQRRTNHQSLSLLNEMIGKLHQDCVQEKMDFKIPRDIVQPRWCTKENATMIIHEMLQQIFFLFISPGLNETVTEPFLNGIYQQMVHLEMALEEEMDQANSTLGSEQRILDLKNYYLGIKNYLKNKEHSSCAWQVVQVEIRRNFVFLYKLTECLKN